MTDFVLDNSVTNRWCFDAGVHEYADRVVTGLRQRPDTAFVPSIWRYEVASVLSRAEIRGWLSADSARMFRATLGILDIRQDDESLHRVLTDVYVRAVEHRLSAYDAAYLELA